MREEWGIGFCNQIGEENTKSIWRRRGARGHLGRRAANRWDYKTGWEKKSAREKNRRQKRLTKKTKNAREARSGQIGLKKGKKTKSLACAHKKLFYVQRKKEKKRCQQTKRTFFFLADLFFLFLRESDKRCFFPFFN